MKRTNIYSRKRIMYIYRKTIFFFDRIRKGSYLQKPFIIFSERNSWNLLKRYSCSVSVSGCKIARRFSHLIWITTIFSFVSLNISQTAGGECSSEIDAKSFFFQDDIKNLVAFFLIFENRFGGLGKLRFSPKSQDYHRKNITLRDYMLIVTSLSIDATSSWRFDNRKMNLQEFSDRRFRR